MSSSSDYGPQGEKEGRVPGYNGAPPVPVVDLASQGPLPPLGDPASTRLPHPPLPATESSSSTSTFAERSAAEPTTFWLHGDVVLCACPDCGAPMTVRLWLMVADCWRCEASIELTEEEEREVRRLWEQHAEALSTHQAASVSSTGESAVTSRIVPADTLRDEEPVAATLDAVGQPHVEHEPLPPPRSVAPSLASRHVRQDASADWMSDWLHRLLQSMPAWLISLLFHIVLLVVLGLLTTEPSDGPYITLSTRISRVVREGGDTRLIEPTDEAVFDLGVPESVNVDDPAQRRALARADQEARELRLTEPDNPFLPEVQTVRQAIRSHSSAQPTLAARDPRVRVEMVRREGGTTLTEAAVARGLRWLAQHQNGDGSWSLDRYPRSARCSCNQPGTISSEAAGTSLALLPFLGAGQTHLTGIYRDSVARGLRWLLDQQTKQGDLRGSNKQYPGMYAQGQAAIVLCEAFLMTGDEALREPAQKAIDFIVEAQYPDGGWRYFPRAQAPSAEGDTSVLGWQLMALQSALAAQLYVPDATLENAGFFLDEVQRADGARYAYLPREDPSPAMTAEGLLCRIYLGWKRDHPPLRDGVAWLLEREPPDAGRPNIYYWYYAAQTMHHFGGQAWDQWNLKMRDVLVTTQEIRGHAAGSWAPVGPLTAQGGRLYMTSLAICCLEVYYRHLPLFRQIELQ